MGVPCRNGRQEHAQSRTWSWNREFLPTTGKNAEDARALIQHNLVAYLSSRPGGEHGGLPTGPRFASRARGQTTTTHRPQERDTRGVRNTTHRERRPMHRRLFHCDITQGLPRERRECWLTT